jgi:pimeloyl-ACP methyl ester carboxylesterase
MTFDFPGHGNSQGTGSNFFEFPLAYQLILEKYKIDGVIAHSLGCGAALSPFSEQFQLKQQIPRLVLVAPHFDLKKNMESWMLSRGFSIETFHSFISEMEKHYKVSFDLINPRHTAPLVDVPTLVLHDQNDRACSVENAKRLHRLLEGSKLRITKGLGHNRILRDPSVIEDVTKFITQA